jgi:hypothetical protein
MTQQDLLPTSSPELLSQLIAGVSTEELVVYDVSDRHVYGCKHKSKLKFSLAKLAVASGYIPVAYQAIHWWCFVYIPVVPLGTYVVLERIGNEDSDAEICRGIQIDMDWRQAFLHWCVGSTILAGILTAVFLIAIQ